MVFHGKRVLLWSLSNKLLGPKYSHPGEQIVVNRKTNIVEDFRGEALRNLSGLLDEALRASLIAQLCARGKSLSEAKESYKNLSKDEVQTLVKPSGGSGYLEFQWISESILEIKASISHINLNDFWEFVRARKNTSSVYGSHLNSALKPINNTTSGIKTNLDALYGGYPGNKVTSELLPILRQIQEATTKIEEIIRELLSLSPPAQRKTPSISRKTVVMLFLISLLSVPLLYWIGAESGDNSTSVATKIEEDVAALQSTVKDSPTSIPKLVFAKMVPMVSNILLLISAALGLTRAFSRDSVKDTKRMSEELTKAAKLLRDLK